MNKYLFFFSSINKIGIKTILKLIDFFGSLENAFDSSMADLKEFGFSNSIIEDIFNKKKNFNFDNECLKYKKLNIDFCSYFEDSYPAILKKIPDPPIIIFYKGNLSNNLDKTIGVVGARNCSDYGVSVARDFCEYFINNDIIPVSGGAIGIDSISHEVAISKNYPTISVMGTGLDIVYPARNKKLFQDIIDNNGAIVSEFPIGANGLPQNFIMRNRIIAGLSAGVFIVEAGIKSGTMTTAEFAIDQNKNVFVVPGSIYSSFSEGTNYLIKNGAIFITNPREIEDMVWPTFTKATAGESVGVRRALYLQNNNEIKIKKPVDVSWMNEDEKNIFDLISYKSINIENIVLKSNLSIQKINSILIILEIKGVIINLGGMNYKRIEKN